MKFKYKMMLSVVLLLLTFSIYVCFDYNVFLGEGNTSETESEEALVFSMDELSVNYLTGNEVVYTGGDYTKEFSITNVSDREIKFSVSLIGVVNTLQNSNVVISITSDDGSVLVSGMKFPVEDIEVSSDVLIDASDTQRYKVSVSGGDNTNELRAQIYISTSMEEKSTNMLVNRVLIDNDVVEPKTMPGKSVALEDEGLIKGEDDYGDTYYFRGNVENNYVSFANYRWRIVRITGDNKVKLILDEDLSGVLDKYNSNLLSSGYEIEEIASLEDATGSSVLQQWYDKNLISYDKYLDEMKFGVESEVVSENGNINYFGVYKRLVENGSPTFKVSGEVSTSKIGLITADEVVYAGALFNEENQSYYLYNENILNSTWTSSLYSYNDVQSTVSMAIISASTGRLEGYSVNYEASLRPVILLDEGLKVSGSGTYEDPYVVG